MSKKELRGQAIGKGYKIGIVIPRFNDLISKELLRGALEELERHSVEECTTEVLWVAGSFEIPQACARMIEKGGYDGILALGCLIEGQTDHYRLLANEVAKALTNLSVAHKVPISFGVLTVRTLEQALERAGTKAGNKGGEAMLSLLEMIDLYKKFGV